MELIDLIFVSTNEPSTTRFFPFDIVPGNGDLLQLDGGDSKWKSRMPFSFLPKTLPVAGMLWNYLEAGPAAEYGRHAQLGGKEGLSNNHTETRANHVVRHAVDLDAQRRVK
jgi:hypothetical protein